MDKRHDHYLMIASLWVVATQVRASLTIFELASVTQSGLESSLQCSTAFKASFYKKTRNKRALASQLCRVRARASMAGENRAKMLGGSDRERKLGGSDRKRMLTTRQALHMNIIYIGKMYTCICIHKHTHSHTRTRTHTFTSRLQCFVIAT